MSVWKQKAEQRAAAEAVHAAVAKTREQRAEEARKLREWEISSMWCDATAEHGLSPGQRRGMERWLRRPQRPRDDLKLDLSKDFPALGK
jgi:hypothetical protein